jgi:hypothetical protein
LGQVFRVSLRSGEPVRVAVQQRVVPFDQISQFAIPLVHGARTGFSSKAADRPAAALETVCRYTIRRKGELFPPIDEVMHGIWELPVWIHPRSSCPNAKTGRNSCRADYPWPEFLENEIFRE